MSIWPTYFVVTRPIITYDHNNGIKFKTEFQWLQIWADSGGGTELHNTCSWLSACVLEPVYWKLCTSSTNRSMQKMSKLNFFDKPVVMILGLRSTTEGVVNSSKIWAWAWTVNFQCVCHTIYYFIHYPEPQALYAWRLLAHFKETIIIIMYGSQ